MPKLTVVNGTLFLGGARCAEMGVNAYSLVEKTWGQASPDNVYTTDLPLIKSRGYNVIRVMAAPYGGTGTYGWGNVVGSTVPTSWSTLNAGYRSKIEAFMDAAGNAGITVLPTCLWDYRAIPDMLGETYENAFKPGSASLAYWEAFAFYFADRFKNHDAYGAHSPFNEWPVESIRGFGTAPFSGWNVHMVRGIANRIWAAMRSADSSRCLIPGTIAPPLYNLSNRWEWLQFIDDTIDASGICDVVDWHTYSTNANVGSEWSGRAVAVSGQDTAADTITVTAHGWATGTEVTSSATSGGVSAGVTYYVGNVTTDTVSLHTTIDNAFAGTPRVDITGTVTATITQSPFYQRIVGLRELLSEARNRAASRGKAFVCGEFGAGGTQEPSGTTRIQAIVNAIKGAGVQLSLAWDWNPRTSLVVASQNQWSIYPGYTFNGYARGDNYLSVISNTGLTPGIRANPPLRYPRRCARFAGVVNNHVVIPHAARYASQEFTVMGWVRMIGRPDAFTAVADYRNGTNSAGWVWLFNSPADAPYIDWRKAGPASAYNIAGQLGRRRANRWYHYAISFSNTQTQVFLDGREFRYFTYGNVGWAPPDGTTNLRLGYNGTNAWSRVDMADFALFDRRLEPQEVLDYVFYGVRPASPAGWWPLQNDANDDSGFNNHGTPGSALAFIPAVGSRLPR